MMPDIGTYIQIAQASEKASNRKYLLKIAQAVQYHIVGKFGGGKFDEFGESSVIRQTKTIQLSTYNW